MQHQGGEPERGRGERGLRKRRRRQWGYRRQKEKVKIEESKSATRDNVQGTYKGYLQWDKYKG